jgi:hypothetical protein
VTFLFDALHPPERAPRRGQNETQGAKDYSYSRLVGDSRICSLRPMVELAGARFCDQRISNDIAPYQQILLPGYFPARIALAEEFQLLIVLRCKIAKMPSPSLAHVPNGAHNHDCDD